MISDDFRQSDGFRTLLSENGSSIVELGQNDVGFSMRFKPLGFFNTLMIPRVSSLETLEKIEKLPYKYRSLFIVIAPKVIVGTENAKEWMALIKKHGYKPAKFGIAPTKTLEIDLRLDEHSILQQMKSKTRYNIKLAQRKGITTEIITGEQILADINHVDKFYKIYNDNCLRVNMKSDTKEEITKLVQAFKHNIFFVYGYLNDNQLCAVALYIVSGNSIAYQMNGSTEEGRRNFATNLVVWEGFREGKKRGCQWFDFDGIYDERFKKAQKAWLGFSRFKLGFGGYERLFLGSFIKWFPFLK